MCGIVGYNGFRDPKKTLLEGLKKLEYRGYDSAGIAVWEKDEIRVFRAEGRIHNLEGRLIEREFDSTLGIGHTRWATHGAPTELNAHPHQVGNITLVHNGIIENYLEHKQQIQALGREIRSETDSEIVAHLLDIEVSKGYKLNEILPELLPRLKGSYAFVILNAQEPGLMVGVRNGAPLLLGIGEGETFIASDVQAILHLTHQIIYLNEKEYALCWKNHFEVRDYAGKLLSPEIKKIVWTPDQMDKAGYRHYMLKEIHEQGTSLTHTIENNIDHKAGIIHFQELENWRDVLNQVERVTMVACGTARHAALIGKDYVERFSHIPVDVDFGSEFRYRDPILNKNTLLVCISQSGETADTLAALREGKARGVPTLAICNVRDSTIAREADRVLYTNAGPEIGVASTKAFTTQLAILYMFSVHLGVVNDTLPEKSAQGLTTELLHLPTLVEKTLGLEKQIEQIAMEHQNFGFFFYMGRGILYPISLEGALKLKEISYHHAEGYASGELKHGPIALVDRTTALIVLSPKDKPSTHDPGGRLNQLSEVIYEKSMSNLQEVKSRGGHIWSIGTEDDNVYSKQSRFFTGVPSTTWALNPILLSIPLQLFAYYVALQKGTDVDKPRNLAKSVTVE